MARSLTLLLLFPLFAFALPEDRELPLSITADQAEFDEVAGIANYQGQVVLIQGALSIQAQELTAYLEDGQVTRLIAIGQQAFFEDIPSLEQGTVTGNANRIEWQLNQENMQLTGRAVLTQDTNRFAGEQVNYRQTDGVIEAQGDGNERVQMTLTPSRASEE